MAQLIISQDDIALVTSLVDFSEYEDISMRNTEDGNLLEAPDALIKKIEKTMSDDKWRDEAKIAQDKLIEEAEAKRADYEAAVKLVEEHGGLYPALASLLKSK